MGDGLRHIHVIFERASALIFLFFFFPNSRRRDDIAPLQLSWPKVQRSYKNMTMECEPVSIASLQEKGIYVINTILP